jgi:hypothetical protein
MPAPSPPAPQRPTVLQLVWLPALITTAISGARLYTQIEGQVPTASGGSGSWLGITWLVLLFGAWFGHRLRASGSRPRVRRAPLWMLLATLLLFAAVASVFSRLDPDDRSETARQVMNAGVPWIAAAGLLLMLGSFAVWPRLSLTLLTYGLLARGVVLALTWWAKVEGWDTHYTKFGPPGFEYDLAGTMQRAALAQLGFWVPFTVLVGGMLGATVAVLFRGRGPDRAASQSA